jgi:hypothetical protein
MIFEDFYEWIMQTLHFCVANDIEIAIKLHPAESFKSELVELLKQTFPGLYFIPKEVNNYSLKESGVRGLVTVHGTAAHEFPYLGIPVLCAGDNPHASFNFARTAKSKEEYFSLLKSFPEIAQKETIKHDVLDFYYCHNLSAGSGRVSAEAGEEIRRFLDGDIKELSSEVKSQIPMAIKEIIPGLIPPKINERDFR